MVLVRKRYYAWLLKAYVKKWKKTIFTSLTIGVIIFFGIIALLNFYVRPFLEKKIQRIGYAGVYTVSTIPQEILENVSIGLTKVDASGAIKPAAALRWEVKDGGREYVFYLKKDLKFHSGATLTSENLNLNFKDVSVKKHDSHTISFYLKNPYAPFLVSVSRPIIIENYSGLGEYILKKIDFNAGFIKSLTFEKKNDASLKKIIYFYPTQEALKTAFALGEVDTIEDVTSPILGDKDLSKWSNVKVGKGVDYTELVTLFYNNNNDVLSDKKIRQALTYALPEKFSFGEKAYTSIPPHAIYYAESPNYAIEDVEIAKTFLSSSKSFEKKELTLTTTEEFAEQAKVVQKAWERIGVKTKIEITDGIPREFQVLLYKFVLPKDPDQYTLWHSQGINNIASYRKNLRIDKLLEDGRQIASVDERVKIYADFQKYLNDDAPASFLYFPTKYRIVRK